jgi:UDP:flavonoid glycosyltransferase YjiC (YdhE family)
LGTVLFAWEMGGGLGHIGPMKVLAESLTKWGHQPVFVVKDVISARPLLEGLGPILQAPVLGRNRTAELAFGAGSFGDILAIRGFADRKSLGASVDSWSDLFDLVRPNLLIADFSPTAILAGRSRMPVVSVGYGFYLPPDHLPRFPVFRDDVPPVVGESALLESVRDVLAERDLGAPKTLPEALRTQYAHVYSLPPLDPYAAFRRTPGFGPIETMPEALPQPEAQAIFAYLSGDHPRIADILIALGDFPCKTELYMRGGEISIRRFAARRTIVVHDAPPSLPEAMARASLVLSHGGGGITHAALLAGRPQLVLPMQAEAYGTAIKIHAMGVGRKVAIENGIAPLTRAMTEVLQKQEFRRAAAATALHAKTLYHPRSRLEGLVETCNELIYASVGRPGQAKPQRATSIA